MNNFWSAVFIRILRGRLLSPEWNAENPSIPESIARLRCFSVEVLTRAIRSEDFAWDIFEGDFSRLPFEWQRRLSGRSRADWLADDRAYRNTVCAACLGTGIQGAADTGNDAPEPTLPCEVCQGAPDCDTPETARR